ncbi:hypothetical protein, partial [Paraburkholderia sp. J41]|uniref:hypothetical protein n=1 Tax=Paraburkholderia sp. J41 TaxID=2805433 RepID=UPI002AC3256D
MKLRNLLVSASSYLMSFLLAAPAISMLGIHAAQAMPPGYPSTASAAYNVGGTVDGKYIDSKGKTYDGTGYLVVVIDGAIRTDHAAFIDAGKKSKISEVACFGLRTGPWPSLCKYETVISRPLAGDPSAAYIFTALDAMPSNAPQNRCSQLDYLGARQACHYFHGTATSGAVVGQPSVYTEGATRFTYTGVAPGAKLVPIKIGGGVGA